MTIGNEQQYTAILDRIDDIMKKGEDNVDLRELQQLKKMVGEIQEYESRHHFFPPPKTIIDMVKVKMFEKDMTQTDLSRATNLPLPKINRILNGKRKPDIDFLKGIHNSLHIPADFIFNSI